MPAGINLAGRIPRITRPVSGRVLILAVGLGLLLLGAVVFGFRYRIRKNEERTQIQQTQTMAADAATSNRAVVEGGLPNAPLAGLPVVPQTPPAQATPNVQPTVQQYAAPAQNDPPASYPAPAYDSPVSAPPVDSIAQARAQAVTRQREREQQAIEAPTGVQPTAATAASDPVNAAQADLAQINSLLRQPNAGQSATTPSPGTAHLSPEMGESGQGYRSQNDQAGKRQFVEGVEGAGDDYLNSTRTPPLSRWVVQRGTVIPAALPHQLVSDLPGDLIAEVMRDVYDSPSQRYVEIPAGSRLVGEYNSSVSYGQNRVQVVWTAIYFPDGSFIDLDRVPSRSADGSTGLKDQTDPHWKRVITGVVLSSLLSAGLQLSQNHSNSSVLTYPSTGQVITSSVGTQASQLGEQLTNRNLNIQPTLKIRTGEIFAVSVKKDILFPGPYEPLGGGK
jgi:type IV secretory pathway VirB10-like protein